MIRPYQLKDKAAVIELLHLNTPKYFHPDEKKDFILYLENELETYIVDEIDGKIVGGGGINYFPNLNKAHLSWDMVHPEYQNQSIGSNLCTYRIEHIKNRADIHQIIVRTTQLSYGFYERMGFKLDFIKDDFWADGFHLYQMSLQKRN
jgi:ribosomal-protein-alanine N-acetyltransferase